MRLAGLLNRISKYKASPVILHGGAFAFLHCWKHFPCFHSAFVFASAEFDHICRVFSLAFVFALAAFDHICRVFSLAFVVVFAEFDHICRDCAARVLGSVSSRFEI